MVPNTSAAVPTKRQTALSVALLALLYLWVFPYQAHVNNPNENVRIFMTVATVDDGTFAINRVERDWGYVNDKSLRQTPLDELVRRRVSPAFLQPLLPPAIHDRMLRNALTPQDRAAMVPMLYSSKGPATSLLGVPAYWLLTKITGRNSFTNPPAAPTPPGARAAAPKHPLDRTLIVYVLRLWTNVLPALFFACFWHRFLGRQTTSPTLREATFFATMAGSLLFAYSEVFASHAHNAFCAAGAFMALSVARERDANAKYRGSAGPGSYGLFALAGALGVAVTCFEYPSAMATLAIGLLVAASASDKRWWASLAFAGLFVVGGKVALDGHLKAGALMALGAVLAYALTLSGRSLLRLASAAAGAMVPLAPTLWFHKRAFGSFFKTGYSFIENPVFHQEHSQGFFGATAFSWESAVRLWADPSFGMITGTPLLVFGVLGFGAWLAPRRMGDTVLGRRLQWLVRACAGGSAVVFAVKLAKVVALLRGNNGAWPANVLEGFHWLGYLLAAVLLLAVVSMPVPKKRDAGVGAAALLAVVLLTRLIGMMNNWRGGWTVGPRYLAALVPIVAWAALVGLDAIGSKSRNAMRASTVLAAGTTASALVLSGLPSVWFPHVPTDFASPVFELFLPLLRGGFVPRNAGATLFHKEGLAGMAPFFAAAAIVVLRLGKGDERRPLAMAAHLAASLAVCCLVLLPFALVARYETAGTTRWAMTMWEPARPRPDRASLGAIPSAETPEASRVRGRALMQAGDAQGATEAFRRAAIAEGQR